MDHLFLFMLAESPSSPPVPVLSPTSPNEATSSPVSVTPSYPSVLKGRPGGPSSGPRVPPPVPPRGIGGNKQNQESSARGGHTCIILYHSLVFASLVCVI